MREIREEFNLLPDHESSLNSVETENDYGY